MYVHAREPQDGFKLQTWQVGKVGVLGLPDSMAALRAAADELVEGREKGAAVVER